MFIHIPFIQSAIEKGFNPEKPLCFLDVDGVMNSVSYCIYCNRNNIEYERLYLLDPQAIKHLNEIADWNFVVSSTWRKCMSLVELQERFNKQGFKGIFRDETPVFNWLGSVRGNEIRAWISENVISERTPHYIIFDDDSDMLLEQKDNFIHVDNHFGLSPNHVYRAKYKLNLIK